MSYSINSMGRGEARLHLDLIEDIVTPGFVIEEGVMGPKGGAGLGLVLCEICEICEK
ncbi:MAG: hypothetical protein ACMZ7B_08965 [Balneola sp.]